MTTTIHEIEQALSKAVTAAIMDSWIGRSVRIVGGFKENIGETGVVLCVDYNEYRPAAWVKVGLNRDYPSYRSVDLCWVEDTSTGGLGPVWGETPSPKKDDDNGDH